MPLPSLSVCREFSAERINLVVNHPDVRPWVGGVGPLDMSPAVADSTEKPESSRPHTISSHACSAPAGSGSTSTRPGHVASASPSRIPGWTPASSAEALTGPTNGSPPGSGASAHGLIESAGRLSRAALRSKLGMERQAITGTYVLPEHTFSCQARRKRRA